MQKIKLLNTLTQKKEELIPLEDGHVRIYACGVTVYDDCHIGHAMQASVFDILVNFLRFVGYRVTYVRNFTDVDDKIINRARELGISPKKLADTIVNSCRKDFKQLRLSDATYEPRVSENIPEIIAMIETLVEKSIAYSTKQGNVYFRVRKFSDYGRLSNRDVEQLQSGEAHTTDKEDALDFALWKADAVTDASWPSPWGVGRPGWHIECSAMAKKYLGKCFDIHGGGRDLIFPHHENEIAQSICANDSPYASIWVHNGLLTVAGQKMAKSLKNHISIADFLKDWAPEVLRLSILTHHYRSNIDFSQEIFRHNRRRLLYYYETILFLRNLVGETVPKKIKLSADNETLHKNFIVALADDLNTPVTLAQLNTVCKKANELRNKTPRNKEQAMELIQLLDNFGQVLGLFYNDPREFINKAKLEVLAESGLTEKELQESIAKRTAARQERNFHLADTIRNDLHAKGIELRDSPDYTEWSILHRIES